MASSFFLFRDRASQLCWGTGWCSHISQSLNSRVRQAQCPTLQTLNHMHPLSWSPLGKDAPLWALWLQHCHSLAQGQCFRRRTCRGDLGSPSTSPCAIYSSQGLLQVAWNQGCLRVVLYVTCQLASLHCTLLISLLSLGCGTFFPFWCVGFALWLAAWDCTTQQDPNVVCRWWLGHPPQHRIRLGNPIWW